MKKFISIIFILVILSSLAPSSFAEVSVPLVYDEASYLTSSEVSELTEKLNATSKNYGVQVAVITEDEMSGYGAESTAEDFYYDLGFDEDCLLLYIADYEREYALVSFGEKGKDAFSDSELSDIEDEILPYLKNDDFSGAIFAFADEAEYTLDVYTNGSTGHKITVIAIAIALSLIIALIAMLVQLSKMKTAVKQNFATNYMKPGSMNLSRSTDLFLYSVVTRKARPKPSQTSSGGSNSRSGKF